MSLPTSGFTEFGGLAARSNYLAADRIDLQFAAKEVCRFMSAQTETSVAAMKRPGRHLLRHKRLVKTYPWQCAEGVHVCSDTAWSGCPRTRRSPIGGCVMTPRAFCGIAVAVRGHLGLGEGQVANQLVVECGIPHSFHD